MYNTVPTIVVSNFAEAHIDFLGRAHDAQEREDLVSSEAYHADRTLLWAGDPKLVFASYPIAHSEWITNCLGFPGTRWLAPQNRTSYLSLDIIREQEMLRGVIDYAGAGRTIQLIPYATTPEFLRLVDVLRTEQGLTVLTPESPDAFHLWVRDYIDTKSGFRQLAGYCLPDAYRLIPFGVVCQNKNQAAQAAAWFCERGEPCVVKPDTGESGVGTSFVHNNGCFPAAELLANLTENPYFGNEPLIVERYIHSPHQESPSLEVFVPHSGQGEPHVTYISQQLFLKFGDFCGILVDHNLLEKPWYGDLERSGLTLARELQKMGYAGHFDLDCVVDEHEQIFLLEINSRRTGGTHVHDFARQVIGDDYLQKAVLLSFEANDSGDITNADELIAVLDDLLFPIQGEPRGVVITITTPLFKHRFGAIFVAPTAVAAIALQTAVHQRLRSYKH